MDVLCPKMKDPTTMVTMPHAVRLNLRGGIKHIPLIFYLRPSTKQVQFGLFHTFKCKDNSLNHLTITSVIYHKIK